MEPPTRATVSPPQVGGAVGGAGRAPSAGPPIEHRVLVAYGSRFGNTQRIAEALANGLRQVSSVAVVCLSIDEVSSEDLRRSDFLAVGGPTEVMSASKPMKEFLAKLPTTELRGKRGFAFDTRLEGRLSGSAGKYIEKHLEQLGVEIVRPHCSALVRGMTKEERVQYGDEGAPDWVRKLQKPRDREPIPRPGPLQLLAPGAEADFEKIGTEIGALLATPHL